MKTITLDYETYEQELKDARESGIRSGVYAATAYVNDPTTYQLRKSEHYCECLRLDEALEARRKKACEDYFDQLIQDCAITVFNHDTKELSCVTEFEREGETEGPAGLESITLYIGLGK